MPCAISNVPCQLKNRNHLSFILIFQLEVVDTEPPAMYPIIHVVDKDDREQCVP